MPSEEFSTPVRGAAGTPIQTTAAGSIQTDNYPAGDGFQNDGTGYPVTIEATDIDAIQEVLLFDVGDIDVEIDTIQGDNFTVRLASTGGRYQTWEIQKAVFRDPRSTGATLSGAWGGE